MPPGRHRHSPPLHKLLPPSVIAGVSVVCAAGAWLSADPLVLRALVAATAVATVVGAVVMRNWDRAAGKRVADLTRARESDGWAHEERVAELEADLEESREIRATLEGRLRQKRAELTGLRNEHAALLRRYATAETERASALEGRRLLAIEAAPADRPAATVAEAPVQRPPVEPPMPPEPRRPPYPWEAAAVASKVERPAAQEPTPAPADPARRPDTASGPGTPTTPEPTPSLFLQANAALDTLGRTESADAGTDAPARTVEPATGPPRSAVAATGLEPATARVPPTNAGGPVARTTAGTSESGTQARRPGLGMPPPARGTHIREAEAVAQAVVSAEWHERADGEPSGTRGRPAAPATTAATAVPPTAPVRAVPKGAFDFFGTCPSAGQEGADSASLLDAVRNEDLADVVGEEALALHKAEEESGFKPATAAERGVGQVIDLTAHDEPERIDVSGLRNAVS